MIFYIKNIHLNSLRNPILQENPILKTKIIITVYNNKYKRLKKLICRNIYMLYIILFKL